MNKRAEALHQIADDREALSRECLKEAARIRAMKRPGVRLLTLKSLDNLATDMALLAAKCRAQAEALTKTR